MKKVILLVLIMVSAFTLCGCKKSTDMDYLKSLTQQNIFTQKEEKYFVFFYRDDCTGCEETKPYIINYWNAVNNGAYQGKRQIYGVNISNEKNTKIYRKYAGTGGQGTDGAYFVDGVSQWDKLYIGSTPSLISIYERDGVRYAKYQAQGKDAILEVLNNYLAN